jgi:hypothetical protein
MSDYLLSERCFDGNCYNHNTRYTVNIKHISQDIIREFQNVLQTPTTKLSFLTTNVGNKELNLKNTLCNLPIVENWAEAFRYVLKFNDNVIIERTFTARKFNERSIYSIEFYQTNQFITELIQQEIKKQDCKQIAEEFLLTEYYNHNVNEVRNMDKEKRQELLAKVDHLF